MNTSGPPPPDESRGSSLIVSSAILHGFSLPIVAARLWTRAWPRNRLAWDDYSILGAVAFDLSFWILVLLAVRHGLGRPSVYVPSDDQPKARAFLYFAQHASGWAVAFAKLSIACMLFRLRGDSRAWRIFLLAMMILPLGIAAVTSGGLFSACRPLQAMWDYTTPNPVCLPETTISKLILTTALITVATDLILALLPLTFIVHMNKTLREKILLISLMGLGLIASAASICKIVNVTSKSLTGDALQDGVDVTFWGLLEIQLGIIAACVPCLKRFVERMLHRLGLLSSNTPT
ncbi:hypothetical protein QBC47DRAFT_281985, partial [Echria macrotheca]